MILRARGFVILMLIVLVLMAAGFGIVKLVALPFGGVGTAGALLLGVVVVIAVLGVLTLFGRRRQKRMVAERRAGG
jgi:hypothetical protein